MKKGGYKIIDFKGTALSGTAVELPGIYDQIVDDFDKAILVSGVSLNDVLQDDAYAGMQEKTVEGSKSVELTVYDGVITVTEDDEVTFTSAKSNTELTEELTELNTLSQLTITRVENAFCDAASISRLSAYKRSNTLFLNCNLLCTEGTTTDFVEIARISGWNCVSDLFTTVSSQTDPTKNLIIRVSPSGVILIYSTVGVLSSFYRTSFMSISN